MYTTGRIFIGVSLGGSRNLSNGVEVTNNKSVNRRGGWLGNEEVSKEVSKEVRTRKLGRGSWDEEVRTLYYPPLRESLPLDVSYN